MQLCRFCKTAPGTMINASPTYKGKRYTYYSCRKCNTERARIFRSTARGKQSVKRAVDKYEQSNPKRRQAWQEAGKVPLMPCEVCSEMPTHRHHPDVEQKDQFVFLCPLHHKAAHRQEEMV